MTLSFDEHIVVVDLSGSMAEMGKALVAQNLLLSIAQHYEFNDLPSNVSMWSLSDRIEPIDSPLTLKAMAKADLAVLQTHLESQIEAGKTVNLLLLSDGFFEHNPIRQFVAWRQRQTQLTVAAVAIGADANECRLGNLATAGQVFKAEDISLALHSIGKISTLNATSPQTIKDLDIEATIDC